MSNTSFDLIVIGTGPGGYVAAIRAAQLGMKVACIDKREMPGGTCLNIGCIPSKALLQLTHKFAEARDNFHQQGILFDYLRADLSVMMQQKEKIVQGLVQGVSYLFKKNKIEFFKGEASLHSSHQVQLTLETGELILLEASKILIATGSIPTPLPGILIDEQRILSSTGALSLTSIPHSMVIIGGGYIGLEIGSIWRRLGCEITVVESLDRIVPTMDQEAGSALKKTLEKQGMHFKLATQVKSVDSNTTNVRTLIRSVSESKEEILESERVLVSVGRKPFVQGLGLERLGIRTTERGFVSVNNRFETNIPGVYAIGDVIGGPMLAHKAEEEGISAVEFMVGQKPQLNYNAVPAVIYTTPEVASVGKTEQELKEAKIPFKAGKFPFQANSRARANNDTEGFVKILAHEKTDEILGVHIVHSEAGTMIAEAVVALEYKASAEDIARICHAHPTTSEAIKEAALNVQGHAIHI
ncbi:MAG: dihydrolipoyl dehydrogenase [Candidatus Paracaedimonas acanthamoebae]|uniref:Dihydrolipoyl dehydrogenase n=1 Tax=Candidatus Paracaedimonas acanthamoebae TaxID=244581 RepID=A0A8J7PY51_9PROT|nr:dihydrolipoyl dehydrogenase [Candidatus Paracaedimonas acanthamoebae]